MGQVQDDLRALCRVSYGVAPALVVWNAGLWDCRVRSPRPLCSCCCRAGVCIRCAAVQVAPSARSTHFGMRVLIRSAAVCGAGTLWQVCDWDRRHGHHGDSRRNGDGPPVTVGGCLGPLPHRGACPILYTRSFSSSCPQLFIYGRHPTHFRYACRGVIMASVVSGMRGGNPDLISTCAVRTLRCIGGHWRHQTVRCIVWWRPN